MSEPNPSQPLVSCILPTYNRRDFFPHAIRYFLRQDYPNKELLVVDDGPVSVEDLVPSHPAIRYVRLPQKITLGAKLNFCCEATSGPFIAQWDDDDWYAPTRLTRQMEALQRTGAQVCGLSELLYYDLRGGYGYRYVYPREERPWLLGSSLFFRRELWQGNRFADIDVGMDALFVWATPGNLVYSVPNPPFAVHLIHSTNVSPKNPQGTWWSDHPVPDIARVMGDDWRLYAPGDQALSAPRPAPIDEIRLDVAADTAAALVTPGIDAAAPVAAPPAPARNVYACLVHESPECVLDLARNLRHLDPGSTMLFYDGGPDRKLLTGPTAQALSELGAVIHPNPRPMRWGSLHQFAIDCMSFALSQLPMDTLTIVDSDQLALRPGWSALLGRYLAQEGDGDGEGAGAAIGMLGNMPERLPPHTHVSAAITAWKEVELWRPLLRRFSDGEEKFVHWTFWPSTTFTADASRALVQAFDHDALLHHVLDHSHLWVTEEIVLPTLTALLGFRIARSPGSYDYVRYRHPYSEADIDTALARPDAHWIHPIPRSYHHPLRVRVREHHGGYTGGRTGGYTGTIAPAVPLAPAAPAPAPPLMELVPRNDVPAVIPLAKVATNVNEIRSAALTTMRRVPGWLSDDEADLLITVADQALAACPDVNALVEIGSYCGKATTVLGNVVRAVRPTARVWAIDPHDGLVGDLDRGVSQQPPTLEMFLENIRHAGLTDVVETLQARTADVAWSAPICLLLVDGLHDYGSVARDFRHFERFLADSAVIAFHDYADYFPGVQQFVDELRGSGRYRDLHKASSLIVLRKIAERDAAGEQFVPQVTQAAG